MTTEPISLGSAAPPPATYAPTPSQARLWFLQRLGQDSPAAHVAAAFVLRGTLDVGALKRAVAHVAERHPALRTCFPERDGGPRAEVRSAPPALRTDALPAATEEARAAWLADEARELFDLADGPLWRAALLRAKADENVLCITAHRIVCDEASLRILAADLRTVYGALAAGRPVPPALSAPSFATIADRRRAELEGDALAELLAYWTAVARSLEMLELPSDRPRPPVQTYRGGRVAFALVPDTAAGVRALAQRHCVDAFVVLLAGFAAVMHRYTGARTIPLGYEVDGRTEPDSAGVIGPLAGPLLVGVPLGEGATFAELLATTAGVVSDALAHQRLPFEQLLEVIRPPRTLAHTPLFEVLVAPTTPPTPAEDWGEAGGEPVEVDLGASRYNVIAKLGEDGRGTLEFNPDLFDADRFRRLAGHLGTLLAGALSDPDAQVATLPLLTAPERHQLLVEWNATAAAVPAHDCVTMFEQQVDAHPDAPALDSEAGRLTYAELDRRANQLAHRLRALGAEPETLVGLCLDRSPDMLVAMLGIIKAGAAFVPLDPDYPPDRLAFMVDESHAPVIVSTEPLLARLGLSAEHVLCVDRDRLALDAEPAGRPDRAAGLDALVYVIYTSGSTGKPKGAQISHRSLINILWAFIPITRIASGDRMLATTSLSFDPSMLELLMPLIVGAEIVLATREVAADGARLRALIAQSSVAIMQATPARWRLLLEAGWTGGDLRTALTGGEALTPDLATELTRRVPAVWNIYGPTETTLWATVERVTAPTEVVVPIGRPIANTELFVLDAGGQPVPVGVPGELYIGGVGLARGYQGRPDLTAERFVPHPFATEPGARLYRTGDLVRYRLDGAVEFLGRTDHQVKVRGFRIELGEIEATLIGHPKVRTAAVVAREQRGEKRLFGYIAPEHGAEPEEGAVRDWLRASLPDYMVPERIVAMPELPLTPTGKIDRRALPDPPASARSADHVAPRDRDERAMTEIWQDVLALDRPVGLTDNFFALGGNSLLAARLLAAAEQWFHRTVPLSALFEDPTVAHLVNVVRSHPVDFSSPLVVVNSAGERPPLFWFSLGLGGVLALRHLQPALGPDQPVYAFVVAALPAVTSESTIEEVAGAFAPTVRELAPDGPLFLAGHSLGGLIAYELATHCSEQGREIGLTTLVDTECPTVWLGANLAARTARRALRMAQRARPSTGEPLFVDGSDQLRAGAVTSVITRYEPRPYSGPIALFGTPAARAKAGDELLGWRDLVRGEVTAEPIEGDHLSILRKPDVDQLVRAIPPLLRRYQENGR